MKQRSEAAGTDRSRLAERYVEQYGLVIVHPTRFPSGSSLGCPWLSRVVSHRLSLDEVNRGFGLMEDQDGIRSVIEFG